ncbi:MAG TPA: HEPN domain-containing protein [Chitinophagaceae bacterium]|nr:HEPN domain-containing protein [Chitinophagaceae bacterium]
MTTEDNDRNDLVRHRIQQAEETIVDVSLLLDNERFRAAINRIYYGMFYALLALASAHQFETSKHTVLIGWFNKKFINQGQADPRFGRIINRAFNKRSKGDYDSFVEFEKADILEMFEEMKEFIAEIKQILKLN